MFTGIIESIGKVASIHKNKDNLHLHIESPISHELKIDQSIAHNGVCLTIVGVEKDIHTVVAIKETLEKSNLAALQEGDLLNLERCIPMNGRLDGHIVQGHVDTVASCVGIEDEKGSYILRFRYQNNDFITVEKGSICINGISLTVIDSDEFEFSVAIIPYTWEHTNLHQVKVGSIVNLEFDILGKYIQKLHQKSLWA